MLVALLAACDPLGRVEAGSPPDVYDALATAMLAELRAGATAVEVQILLAAHRPVSPAAARRFAAAAVDWWAHAEPRWAAFAATA